MLFHGQNEDLGVKCRVPYLNYADFVCSVNFCVRELYGTLYVRSMTGMLLLSHKHSDICQNTTTISTRESNGKQP